jgi:hypothetical protein
MSCFNDYNQAFEDEHLPPNDKTLDYFVMNKAACCSADATSSTVDSGGT